MDVVSAAAVNPATAFSLSEEALTSSLPFGLAVATALDGLTGGGLKKASELGTLFWLARVNGRAIETAEVEAIGFLLCLALSLKPTPSLLVKIFFYGNREDRVLQRVFLRAGVLGRGVMRGGN
ncbi:hypothetical protein QQP08_026309 [Theobroma cacao]|nr:hypothetical protein QQP08_026309 [Theobroma cacao]